MGAPRNDDSVASHAEAFEQVGLALAVGADEDRETRAEVELGR